MTAATLFEDRFNGHVLDSSRWRIEMMQDGLHRAPAGAPRGARWAARYDRPTGLVLVRNGRLEMRGRYADGRLDTCWIDTCSRRWDEARRRHVRAGPAIAFGPGCCIEATVDLSRMVVPGHRWSIWLMPAPPHESDAYDASPAAVEVNVEYDPARPELLCCYLLGGAAGKAGAAVDTRAAANIDLRDGAAHTIAIEWTAAAVIWRLDGRELARSAAPLVPSVEHYLILSREANRGTPEDFGLYGADVMASVAQLPADVAIVYAVRVTRPGAPVPSAADRARELQRRTSAFLRARAAKLRERTARSSVGADAARRL